VKKVIIFVLVMSVSFGGMFLVMQHLKDGHDKAEEVAENDPEHAEEEVKKEAVENDAENEDTEVEEEEEEEENDTQNKDTEEEEEVVENDAEHAEEEEEVAENDAEHAEEEEEIAQNDTEHAEEEEEIAQNDAEHAEEEVTEEVTEIDAEEEVEETSKEETPVKPEFVEGPTSYLGYVTDDAIASVFNVYNAKIKAIDDSIAALAEANQLLQDSIAVEDRIAIASIEKGYIYSTEHDRAFLPGIVLHLKNITAQTISEPVKIKVRYKRIATNEIWSVEETTIDFGKNKILEEDEVITRRFFSDKGVLSMKHIMPDLEAKVYINGKLLTTFKVGEIEYLGW
jgi:hypothetical protein